MVRPGNLSVTLLFPWFSWNRCQAICANIQRYITHAIQFRLPDNTQASPLASAVQGLGIFVATLLGVSGIALFFGMDADGEMVGWVHAVKEGHEVLGSLLWGYLVVHASMAVLHQWVWTNVRILMLSSGIIFSGADLAVAEDARHPDHEMARRLVQSGEILPLERIIDNDRVRGRRLLDVELEKKHGEYMYEVEVVDERGNVMEFRFDAKTGETLREKIE